MTDRPPSFTTELTPATGKIGDDGEITVYANEDINHVAVHIVVGMLREEWDKFSDYCSRRGHGDGERAIRDCVTQMLMGDSFNIRLDDNRTKSTFSRDHHIFYAKLAKYLVFSHLTVIIVGYLVEMILQTGGYSYIISTYAYQVSLCFALLAWGGVFLRSQFIGDRREFLSASERSFFLKLSRWCEAFWFISALILMSTIGFRFLSIFIELKSR